MGGTNRRLEYGRRERFGILSCSLSALVPNFTPSPLLPWVVPSMVHLPSGFYIILSFSPCPVGRKGQSRGASTSLVCLFFNQGMLLNTCIKICRIQVSLLEPSIFLNQTSREMPESVLYSPSAHIGSLFITFTTHLSSIFASHMSPTIPKYEAVFPSSNYIFSWIGYL